MSGEVPRAKGVPGAVATVLGAITAAGRPKDPLIRAVAGAGVAGVLCLVILHYWGQDRQAERLQRHQEHVEMVQLLRDQHQEDLQERRHAACVAEQMTTTVRAAIWRERPPAREACP